MSGIPLTRHALRVSHGAQPTDPHPGLLLQRCFPEHDESDSRKTDYLAGICKSTVDDFYRRAFQRWTQATAEAARFRSVPLKIETRLFIGLTGGGMLETGCAISHSYGTPYIPGSTIKGVVVSNARGRLGADLGYLDELFGADAGDDRPAGLSGLLTFHDAWWKPGSAASPLVQEVVTTHHKDYYGGDGKSPATDFDSPVPNAQVAVRGAFLFTVEGPPEWLDAAECMLVDALTTRGAGAKTHAGYGLFRAPEAAPDPGRDWVEAKLAELSDRPGVTAEQAVRGKGLADAWSAIGDPAVKEAALADIRARWTASEWDAPQGRAAKKARSIYASAGSA